MSESAHSSALADNVVRFARLLRAAGLPIGPAAVVDAVQSLGVIDLGQREDVKACLRAVLVHNPEDRELFEHAFRLYFTAPQHFDPAIAQLLPRSERAPGDPRAAPRRVAEALQTTPPPTARSRQQASAVPSALAEPRRAHPDEAEGPPRAFTTPRTDGTSRDGRECRGSG